jgi:hypothetical protein
MKLERSLDRSQLNSSYLSVSKPLDTDRTYDRPGEVENASLLMKGNSMQLKPNLMEHHDYIGLP